MCDFVLFSFCFGLLVFCLYSLFTSRSLFLSLSLFEEAQTGNLEPRMIMIMTMSMLT